MTEQELRALVRTAIAAHLRQGYGGQAPEPSHLSTLASAFAKAPADRPSHHSSHQLLVLPAGADTDGPCIIEPAVTCNHCGYCKSYGH